MINSSAASLSLLAVLSRIRVTSVTLLVILQSKDISVISKLLRWIAKPAKTQACYACKEVILAD
jgi:hypothetical protein